MGGNAKYKGARTRTATYEDTDGMRKAVRDSNGNIIQIGVGRQVGRDKRTNTSMRDAYERMQNAKAMQQVRDLAKTVRTIRSVKIGQYTWQPSIGQNVSAEDLNKASNAIQQLATIANQVQPGSTDAIFDQNATKQEIKTAVKNIESVLGVRLH